MRNIKKHGQYGTRYAPASHRTLTDRDEVGREYVPGGTVITWSSEGHRQCYCACVVADQAPWRRRTAQETAIAMKC